MPRIKALKVFRTPIGFHDAYVATPTKKAALEVWGSHRNLFALGEAVQVTDPKLMRAALAAPGVVIKVSRGTTAEQLEALKPNEDVASNKPSPARTVVSKTPQSPKRPPRPSRSILDRAEASLATKSAAYAKLVATIDAKIEKLRQRRDALVTSQSGVTAVLEAARESAQIAYDSQLAKWQSGE